MALALFELGLSIIPSANHMALATYLLALPVFGRNFSIGQETGKLIG